MLRLPLLFLWQQKPTQPITRSEQIITIHSIYRKRLHTSYYHLQVEVWTQPNMMKYPLKLPLSHGRTQTAPVSPAPLVPFSVALAPLFCAEPIIHIYPVRLGKSLFQSSTKDYQSYQKISALHAWPIKGSMFAWWIGYSLQGHNFRNCDRIQYLLCLCLRCSLSLEI